MRALKHALHEANRNRAEPFALVLETMLHFQPLGQLRQIIYKTKIIRKLLPLRSLRIQRMIVLANVIGIQKTEGSMPDRLAHFVLLLGLSLFTHTQFAMAEDTGSLSGETLAVGVPGPRFEALWRFGNQQPPYTVTFAKFGGSAPVVEALLGGGIDIGLAGEIGVIAAQAAGADIRIVAALRDNPELLRLLVPKDSAVKKLADLKGKTIAVAKGTSAHTLILRLMREAGLTATDFNWAYLVSPDGGAAFQQGNVDAWATWDPFAATAELKWGARTIAQGTDALSGYTYWIAKPDLFTAKTAKAEAAREFVARYAGVNGSEMKQLPAWTAALAAAMKLDPDVSSLVAQRYHFQSVPLGSNIQSSYADTAELLRQQDIIKVIPDVEKAFDLTSVNPAVEKVLAKSQ